MSQSTIERKRKRLRGSAHFVRSMKTLGRAEAANELAGPSAKDNQRAPEQLGAPCQDEQGARNATTQKTPREQASGVCAECSPPLSSLDAIRADLAPYKAKYGTLAQAVESMSVRMPWEK